jgi:hypothetical protein
MRWFALGAPYTWFGFATRFEDSDEFVGAEFFREFAQSVGAAFMGKGTDAGLMDSFDNLVSNRFDPSKVHPIIRDFYEHTSRFDMDVTIRWNPFIRPLGALYRILMARRMRQLAIPLDNELLSGLDSWLELIDLESDGRADFRCWIRVAEDSGVPVYVGAYKTYKSMIDEVDTSYVSVAFPLPGGNLTTVLTPLNLDRDGLMLTTRDRFSTEAGVYLIFPHPKSFSMAPALGLSEQFQLRPMADGSGIDVVHDCFWLGMSAFQMRYKITPMQPRERTIAEALFTAVDTLEHRPTRHRNLR